MIDFHFDRNFATVGYAYMDADAPDITSAFGPRLLYDHNSYIATTTDIAKGLGNDRCLPPARETAQFSTIADTDSGPSGSDCRRWSSTSMAAAVRLRGTVPGSLEQSDADERDCPGIDGSGQSSLEGHPPCSYAPPPEAPL